MSQRGSPISIKAFIHKNGEDGIIEEIFKRIGTTNKYFVEFGVHGLKNNSTFLLLKNWSGLWIGDSDSGEKTAKRFLNKQIAEGKLIFRREWITKDNIESIFRLNDVPKEFDQPQIFERTGL